jgi:hypothetical protein
MLGLVESWAKEKGFSKMACDTSGRASELITFYTKRGYRHIGPIQWNQTNYPSVMISRR